jgi:phage baseplate assembly protein W
MDQGQLFGRGTRFPPGIGENGQLVWSEGPQNIREAIRIILLTEPGERLMLPDFGAGLKRFLFEPNTVTTHRLIQQQISESLEQWERRINLKSVAVEPDPEDLQAASVTIHYNLVTTGAAEQLSLTMQLTG